MVKCVLPLLNMEVTHVKVKADDKKNLSKSVLGRFPCLETSTGACISGGLSIIRHLASEHDTFYGTNAENKARIDMWCDHTTALVVPATNKLLSILANEQDPAWTEARVMALATKEFTESVEPFKNHLKLRNFLEGYNMTLADIWLALVCS